MGAAAYLEKGYDTHTFIEASAGFYTAGCFGSLLTNFLSDSRDYTPPPAALTAQGIETYITHTKAQHTLQNKCV